MTIGCSFETAVQFVVWHSLLTFQHSHRTPSNLALMSHQSAWKLFVRKPWILIDSSVCFSMPASRRPIVHKRACEGFIITKNSSVLRSCHFAHFIAYQVSLWETCLFLECRLSLSHHVTLGAHHMVSNHQPPSVVRLLHLPPHEWDVGIA